MTRFLSAALGAPEPTFSQSIQQLEHAAGRPSADIRLTSELMQRMRQKITALGLDPDDTTGPELYAALHERLKADDAAIRAALGVAANAAPVQVAQAVQKFVQKCAAPYQVFALKPGAAKRLLKKKLPKNAMKRLGYRSADSMLKHEPAALIYAAAVAAESDAWHRGFRSQYAKLTARDFEMRDIQVIVPAGKRWQSVGEQAATAARYPLLAFPELGSVVLLPLTDAVDGLAITTALLTLEEINGIRAHSSYAKLQQVKPDFGSLMQQASVGEPLTSATLANQAVPWRMIQRYYARFQDAYHPEIFEPHIQADDLQWQAPEDVLARVAPSLAFWQDTQCLGLLHEGHIVSCNVADVAVSYCNHLPFASRVVHFVRDNIWHELMMRYLHQDNLERAVHQQLSNELARPLALAAQEVYNEA